MQTSSFFHYTGPGRISIARFAPRGTPGGFRIYKPLAPRKDMMKMPLEPYRQAYFQDILGNLDPKKVVADLEERAGGHEPVLLCWESPADIKSGKTFCHRRMVAEWLNNELGLVVREIGAG